MLGDILFYQANDLGGTLIQWRTRGPYTHVCVDVGADDVGNPLVVEARWPHVLLDGPGHPAARVSPPNLKQTTKAVAWIKTTVGDNYEVKDILANIFPFLLGTTHLSTRPTAFICSQLAAYFLLEAGYAFPAHFATDEKSMALVSPNDLARLLGVLLPRHL